MEASPRDPATGATVAVRLAGGGSKAYNALGFTDWRAGVAEPLRVTTSIGFDQGGWSGASAPQTGAMRFSPTDRALLNTLADYVWKGASITISSGDDEAAAPSYTLEFEGTVAECKVDGMFLSFAVADLSVTLNKPTLPDTFAGTGDLEGAAVVAGRIKRRTWGKVFNVEGRILDVAYNIYEFGDPSRPLNGFTAVKDKGREGPLSVVAWAGTALATLNALRATRPPDGGAAIAPSIACVKWWTVPSGPLTADIEGEVGSGYVDIAADIAARIVSVYAPTITISNLATAITWQGGEAGIHVDSSSETIANTLDRLLLPIRTLWILGVDGVLVFRLLTWSGPVEDLLADTVARETVYQPLKTRRVGYQRNHRKHTDGEISAVLLPAGDNLIPGPTDRSSWQLSGGAVLPAALGDDRPAELYPAELTPQDSKVTWSPSGAIRTTPGEKLWLSFVALADGSAGASDYVEGGFLFILADGTTTTVSMPETQALGSDASVDWVYRVGTYTAPAGAAFVEGFTERPLATAGTFYVGEPYLGRHEPGADVTASAQLVLSTCLALTVHAASDGTIAVDVLPIGNPAIVTRGGVSVTLADATTYVVQNETGGCVGNVTVDNTNGSSTKGVVAIGTGFDASGTYELVGSYEGVQIGDPRRVVVTKEVATGSASGGTGTGGPFDTAGQTASGGSYVEWGRILGVVKGTGETISANYGGDYSARVTVGGGTRKGLFKWQYATAGTNFAAPVDMGSAVHGPFSTWNTDELYANTVSVVCNQTATPANGTYDVRLLVAIDTTPGSIISESGSATVSVT